MGSNFPFKYMCAYACIEFYATCFACNIPIKYIEGNVIA